MSGLFLVSLDFELLWGVIDKEWREAYKPNVLGGRKAIPRLLGLFREYGIRATWATVGLAMCKGRDEAIERLGALCARRAAPGLSLCDYLRNEVGKNEGEDPLHFAPSLVEEIAAVPGQEIGSHSFSHYYCMEEGADLASFEADMRAASLVAEDRGHAVRALVLPRNQVREDFLPAAADAGITCYRGAPRGSWMYSPRAESGQGAFVRALRLADAYLPVAGRMDWDPKARGGNRPIDLPASRFLRPCMPRLGALEGLRATRIADEMAAAARSGRAYHLWWHPHNFGAETEGCFAILGSILETFATLRGELGFESATMSEAAAIGASP